jgi:hypothetical protein
MPAPFYSLGGGLLKHITQSAEGGGGSDDVSLVVIKKQEITTGVASVEFVDGSSDVVFDGTYSTYLFNFEGMYQDPTSAGSAEQDALFQTTTDGSTWNAVACTYAKTNTWQYRDGSGGSQVGSAANTTAGSKLGSFPHTTIAFGGWNGYLYFYHPSNTTMYKQSQAMTNSIADASGGSPEADHWLQSARTGGTSWQTTSAITGVKFFVTSGTIDSGVITLYGLKTTS